VRDNEILEVFDMGEKIRAFGSMVNDIIGGKSLTREEARDMFRQVLLNEQPDLQQGAFLAAITAKGATPQEIAGSWEAIYEIDTVKVTPNVDGPLSENSGTGMDTLKTFNISTAAAIVAAADGVVMAKHGARAITSRCGTVDMAEALGVDMECDAATVKRSIEKAGIGMFNGSSPLVHPTALGRILSQIRFGTILNIAGSLANPALPTYGVRGVYSKDMILPTLTTMREVGYRRAIVFNGSNGDGTKAMDELSTLGTSTVSELDASGGISDYTIAPQELGIKVARESDIMAGTDVRIEALRLLQVLGGEERGPRQDIVCLNAAPLLLMNGRAFSLADGVERARSIIENGLAMERLKLWTEVQSRDPDAGREQLEGLIERASGTA
jgi:anthranilate phosphoribosyltransferase